MGTGTKWSDEQLKKFIERVTSDDVTVTTEEYEIYRRHEPLLRELDFMDKLLQGVDLCNGFGNGLGHDTPSNCINKMFIRELKIHSEVLRGRVEDLMWRRVRDLDAKSGEV